MNGGDDGFPDAFQALTDHRPLRWQVRLYQRLRWEGTIPSQCELPTGLGKTSVIPIWLIALARQGGDDRITLPRRLVYVVNRRTVVDQATTVVEEIRERLLNPHDDRWSTHEAALGELVSGLGRLSAGSSAKLLVAVSTLRGELADNEEWKSDPARPAIVIGTIDMVGSKLLFSGYGDGRYHRAHHAGLIGQDALIVHDEAHLTPAFSGLLRSVVDAQERCNEPRPVRVIEMSATRRTAGKAARFGLEAEDEEDEVAKQRLGAKKCLQLTPVRDGRVEQRLAELAWRHEGAGVKVLIYARTPERAQKSAEIIRNRLGVPSGERVALLTGTMRGYERDRLVKESRVYRAFLNSESTVAETVYLVSTSAGEVGVDLDADHMVCDLTTLDSMFQRLGRVNRRGGNGRAADVDVVWGPQEANPTEKATDIDRAMAKTLEILQEWTAESGGKLDVSPRKLGALVEGLSDEDRTAAFSPEPAIPPLTDILLDDWSLTSVEKMPGRPQVCAYLHGLTHDPPETYLAWRKEVTLLADAGVSADELSEWFACCRIEPHERLRDRTDRIQSTLSALLRAHREDKKDRGIDFPVVLVDERGTARFRKLSEVVEEIDLLRYCTLVLPVEAGGLDDHGMPSRSAVKPSWALDIAEATARERGRQRWLEIGTSDGEWYQRLVSEERFGSLPPTLRERQRIVLKQAPEDREDEGEHVHLLLLLPRGQQALGNPEVARVEQTLGEHTKLVRDYVAGISDRLGLKNELKDALVRAAEWHDRGKDRAVWQRYARNPSGGEPLAKSSSYLDGGALGGYRHEFGSLLEAMGERDLQGQPERDLTLHLIAAHHGHGRPHFDRRAFDRERFATRENEAAAAEAMRRFGRLQQRFGRWGLAWLESVLRCADILASQIAAAGAEEDNR